MNQPTDEQVLRAARKMCQRTAEECGVDERDNWAIYGNDYLLEARIVLEAAFNEDKP